MPQGRLRRLGVALLALVLLSSLLSRCAPPGRNLGAPATKEPTLTVWIGPSPTLHPHASAVQLTSALFSPLVVAPPEVGLPSWGAEAPGALLASLASSDLRRWDLVIKSGWRWHDGTEVTSEDVARGIRAAMASSRPVTSTITDIRVIDKTALSLALSGPYGQLPALLADPAFLPLPELADTDPGRFASAPVGNGPYRLVGRDGELLQLEAVVGHPGGRSRTATLRADLSAAPSRIDDVWVGVDGAVEVPAVGPAQVLTRTPGRQLAYLGFPLTDDRYEDVARRQALSLAIDRAGLAQDVLAGAVLPADRLLGPGMAQPADVTCAACAFDPEQAQELWPGPLEGPLTIWFSVDAGHEAVVDAVAASWQEVLGVENIQLASLPAEDLLARLRAAQVSGPFRLTWAADVPSPSRLLQPLFGRRGVANDMRYRSPVAAALLDAADLVGDPVEALQAAGAAEQQVLDDLPLLPLWFSTIPVIADADVDVRMDGLGRLDWPSLARG